MSEDISFKHTGLRPDCVFPLMSHLPGIPNSLGMHGSAFFVRRSRKVYLITARHCLGKLGDDLEAAASRLVIPYKVTSKRTKAADYLKFSSVKTARSLALADYFVGDGDLDIAVLEITIESERVHKSLLSRAIKLPPNGEWLEKAFLQSQNQPELGEFRIRARGYPRYGTETEIDHDSNHVILQGVNLSGKATERGPYPHSLTMLCDEGSPITDGNGLSGGPVFMRLRHDYSNPNAKKQYDYYLAGMIVSGKFPNVHFVMVNWLTAVVDRI